VIDCGPPVWVCLFAYSILSALRECRPRMGEIKIRAVRRLAAMAILMRRTLVRRGADL
jgi:hypothetical protein